MSPTGSLTFGKEERACSKKLIERLFGGGANRAMTAFPIRLVYMRMVEGEGGAAPVQVLISVPKRQLKRAVKRNRAKRQIREAFRKNKSLLYGALAESGERLAMAFIWIDDRLHPSETVERKVANLLQRLSEKVSRQ